MQIGMIGLGRMGAAMVRRLLAGGHTVLGFDINRQSVEAVARDGAAGAASLEDLATKLAKPRVAWLMLPAGLVDQSVNELADYFEAGDIIVDGGNSHHADDVRRAAALSARDIHYVDVGVSGGVWGLERGFCQMIGGSPEIVRHLEPVFRTLAPPDDPTVTAPSDGGESTAARGYLHCGPNGAGHFVKMVHNGIEYGVMASFAEGFNILKHAGAGAATRSSDAETSPMRDPDLYRYQFDLPAIAEVWRRGSVIRSWLLDLTASAFARDPRLDRFDGRVSDSGEGRWTLEAAIDEGVPAPVLSAAVYQRFSSQGSSNFADRLLSALRYEFGGHMEKKTEKKT